MKYLIRLTLLGFCVMGLVGCASGHQVTQGEASAAASGTIVGIPLGILGGVAALALM